MENITSVYQMMEWLSKRNIPYEIAGKTNMGLPIIVIKKEGVGRPVMITAGAHSPEPSGVSAALQILENWNYSFPLYMMPLRDPLGCQSYAEVLSHAINREVSFDNDYDKLNELLHKYADEVYVDNGDFVFVRIGELLFVNLKFRREDAGFRQSERYVNEFIDKNPQLLDEFVGRRVICPANMVPESETVRSYERAFTAEISRTGIVADNNRRFGSDNENPEVRICRELCDEANPALVLDLHEGMSNTYYFFVSNYTTDPRTKFFVDRMAAACAEEFPAGPWTLSDLCGIMPECKIEFREPIPGVLEHIPGGKQPKVIGSGFTDYAAKYCPSTTVEAGTAASLEQRVKVHLICAKAALDYYEEEIKKQEA
ncbi:MAG: hypothetical protein IJP24_04770 [Firmicutes bacterium]|nr:hypothetical protein [Bacillota bacterium]MBQ9972819.1 hypothetical protein [Bacillota bacterium]